MTLATIRFNRLVARLIRSRRLPFIRRLPLFLLRFAGLSFRVDESEGIDRMIISVDAVMFDDNAVAGKVKTMIISRAETNYRQAAVIKFCSRPADKGVHSKRFTLYRHHGLFLQTGVRHNTAVRGRSHGFRFCRKPSRPCRQPASEKSVKGRITFHRLG